MACGSCGSKKSNIVYVVTLPGQAHEQRVDTAAEARQVIIAAGNPAGATFTAVPK